MTDSTTFRNILPGHNADMEAQIPRLAICRSRSLPTELTAAVYDFARPAQRHRVRSHTLADGTESLGVYYTGATKWSDPFAMAGVPTSTNSARDLTPMERFWHETAHEQPWNAISETRGGKGSNGSYRTTSQQRFGQVDLHESRIEGPKGEVVSSNGHSTRAHKGSET